MKKINLLNLKKDELKNFFDELGEFSFRSCQVMNWIYRRYCSDFYQMTNLSKLLRIKLNQIAEIRSPKIIRTQRSLDGTFKWSMQVDNQRIETVYIPEKSRATLCISSQIGCSVGCTFCNTAQQGFNRNLYVSEIVGQVWQISKFILSNKISNGWCSFPITHIVFMGMGEPLLNLKNVVSAISIILDKFGFGFSKRHVILSTSGIVPAIEKLKDMIDISLAVSLHAPNDVIRNKIMPINKKYNINSLLQTAFHYVEMSHANRGRLMIEYVLLHRVNDEISHAYQLAEKLKKFPCKVNLIPWNSIPGVQYMCSSNTRIRSFLKVLLQNNIQTMVRKVRGSDINAACGQLAGEVVNRIKYDISV